MTLTLQFLKHIKTNNNKEWFDANKHKYLQAKEEHEVLVEKIVKEIAKFDKAISPDMKAKECTFRIYKDVRFSKDKTPYKTNFGASFNPGGKKSTTPGYYLHLEPGGSFIAGGYYMPEAEHLSAIRQEIDYNSKDFLKILNAASFKTYYKGLDEMDTLKTAPKGYEKDHPMLKFLKQKHFIVSHALTDKQAASPDLTKEVAKACKAMQPFIDFLRNAVS
jgi:uncharacterized protein (TIGR02453 family)